MTQQTDRLNTAFSASLADRYRIERELGAGGMATVYLAEDLKHDRKVAIKVLHPELGATIGGDRFLAEIKTTAKLQHPHILPLLDSGVADGLLFYVMPHIAGETLRARLEREHQLPIDDALRIAREVADALGAAHALGIVHRDIKPENILLQGGHALVADFGIALAVHSAAGGRMTQTGLSLGTPQYMSPEQAMGERHVDHRTDVYALGAVTYEMLTGDPPFTGSSVQAIVAKVMSERPSPIRVIRDTVAPSVEAAVLKALAKLPADRHATANEFVSAFTAATAGYADAAPAARSPRARGAAMLAAVAVAALATGWLVGRGASPRATGRGALVDATIPLADSTVIEPSVPVAEGEVAMAISPDASMLVIVGRTASGTRLELRRTGDDRWQPLPGTEGAYAPFFSPRGDQIGFFAGGKVIRFSVVEQRATVVLTGVDDAYGGAWIDDNRIVFSDESGSVLRIVTVGGDSIRRIVCGRWCTFPEPMPDGRHAIVGTASELSVADLERGTFAPLRAAARPGGDGAPGAARGMMARYDGDGHLVWVEPDGHLVAAPFDAARIAFTGPPVSIAQDVRVETGRGAAQFAISSRGVLVYANGPLRSVGTIVRADRAGKVTRLPVAPADYRSLEITHDGRRLLAVVDNPAGERVIHVIDVASGRDVPLVSGRDLGNRPLWMADSRRVLVWRGERAFAMNPDFAGQPEALHVVSSNATELLADTTRYVGVTADTVFVRRLDGTGSVSRTIVPATGIPAVSPDGRWIVNEEFVGSEKGMVAQSIDGTNRRIVLGTGGKFSMPFWELGTSELIFAAQAARRGTESGVAEPGQEFYGVSYTAGAAEPFGQPRLLFQAKVADFPGRNYSLGGGGTVFVFKQHLPTTPIRAVRVLADWHDRLTRHAQDRGQLGAQRLHHDLPVEAHLAGEKHARHSPAAGFAGESIAATQCLLELVAQIAGHVVSVVAGPVSAARL